MCLNMRRAGNLVAKGSYNTVTVTTSGAGSTFITGGTIGTVQASASGVGRIVIDPTNRESHSSSQCQQSCPAPECCVLATCRCALHQYPEVGWRVFMLCDCMPRSCEIIIAAVITFAMLIRSFMKHMLTDEQSSQMRKLVMCWPQQPARASRAPRSCWARSCTRAARAPSPAATSQVRTTPTAGSAAGLEFCIHVAADGCASVQHGRTA